MSGTSTSRLIVLLYQLYLVAIFFLSGGCAAPGGDPAPPADVQPASVTAQQLRPGLKVVYFYELYRFIGEMPQKEEIAEKGRPGPPVLQLDHRFGAGEVFNSGADEGVGMLMSGFLNLPEPGNYSFQAVSNDGVEMMIDHQVIVSDPGVHKDKISDPGGVTAADGGWFPLEIRYFQRKGTAMLEMYWQPPGSSTYSIIPADAYAHLP